ncbi:MAG TPA: hypothetical protein VGR66_00600 [Candidatus Eisenbacteria bacterium]|nr:hypothetical protein [Candidatus Eisenbacteria bacterium]
MKRFTLALFAAGALAAPAFAHAQNGRFIDFPLVVVGNAIEITGGGTVNPQTGLQRTGGQFRAVQDITAGPLKGLRAGDGVRWEAAEFLPSAPFKCVGSETAKTVLSGHDTIVMKVNFFTRGDGNTPSFTANVFVSTEDQDSDQPGFQNVWIQGVGCGEAQVDIR